MHSCTVRPRATLPRATLTSRLHYFETGPKIFEQHWFSRVTLFYIRFTKFSSKLNGIFEKDWFWLSVHRRQHICEKSSVCFLSHIELIIHTASAHEEEHICEIYGAKFVCQIDLESYIESVHEGKKQHKCKKCSTGFVNKIDFRSHIASVHK